MSTNIIMENLTQDSEIDVKLKKKRGRPKKVKINDTLDEIVREAEAEAQKEIKKVNIEINEDRIYTTGQVKKVLNCLFTKREYFNEVLKLTDKYD